MCVADCVLLRLDWRLVSGVGRNVHLGLHEGRKIEKKNYIYAALEHSLLLAYPAAFTPLKLLSCDFVPR